MYRDLLGFVWFHRGYMDLRGIFKGFIAGSTGIQLGDQTYGREKMGMGVDHGWCDPISV